MDIIEVIKADITTLKVDAIVNAANTSPLLFLRLAVVSMAFLLTEPVTLLLQKLNTF